MDIPTVSAKLCHADTNITNQYYVHNIPSRDKIASDKIRKFYLSFFLYSTLITFLELLSHLCFYTNLLNCFLYKVFPKCYQQW